MMATLAISHLVISAPAPDETVAQLSRYGYRLHHGRDDVPNRRAKAPFLQRPMPETTTMRLVLNDRRRPAIEVIRENRLMAANVAPADGEPAFDMLFDRDTSR
jgi:hypothetical protein